MQGRHRGRSAPPGSGRTPEPQWLPDWKPKTPQGPAWAHPTYKAALTGEEADNSMTGEQRIAEVIAADGLETQSVGAAGPTPPVVTVGQVGTAGATEQGAAASPDKAGGGAPYRGLGHTHPAQKGTPNHRTDTHAMGTLMAQMSALMPALINMTTDYNAGHLGGFAAANLATAMDGAAEAVAAPTVVEIDGATVLEHTPSGSASEGRYAPAATPGVVARSTPY